MIDLIIVGAQMPLYIATWRWFFRKIAYWFVVEQRKDYAPQLEPDWGDIGWGIVGATLLACLWPIMLLSIAGYGASKYTKLYINSKTRPIEVAEKLGGKAPKEVRYALLDEKIRLQELELGITPVPQMMEAPKAGKTYQADEIL